MANAPGTVSTAVPHMQLQIALERSARHCSDLVWLDLDQEI